MLINILAAFPGTLNGNRRSTTAKSFLIPAKNRSNLHIVKNAHATKVLINEKKETTGVEFMLNKRKLQVIAKKEVILSAGSVNTPQILNIDVIGHWASGTSETAQNSYNC